MDKSISDIIKNKKGSIRFWYVSSRKEADKRELIRKLIAEIRVLEGKKS